MTTQVQVRRARGNPQYYLRMYEFMQEYHAKNGFSVSIGEMVEAGFATSTSVIRFYLNHMEKLKMIRQPKLIRNGKSITPPRSTILLPLDEAETVIANLIVSHYFEKEPEK